MNKIKNTPHFYRTVVVLLFLCFSQNSIAQNTPDFYFNKAYNYLSVDKAEAINNFDKCLELDENYVAAYHMRGIAKYKLGKYSEAISDFQKAVARNSHLAIAHLYQGYAYKNMGEEQKALSAFKKYTETKSTPSNLDYQVLGKVQLAEGAVDDAIETFGKIPESTSVESQFLYRYLAYHEARKYPEAISEINRAIALNDKFYGYYIHRGQSNFMSGAFDASIRDFTQAVELSAEVSDSYYLRGLALDTLGRKDEAIKDFSKAISLNPEDGSYYSKRGNAKYTMGERDAACLDWTIAGNFGYYEDFDKIKQVCK